MRSPDVLYSRCLALLLALCMKTQTKSRTATSTSTTVALSIAIGAAAAFAAISLNGNFFKQGPSMNELPLKGGPVYTRQMCQTSCIQAYDLCNAKTGAETKCANQYYSCFDGCNFYPLAESLPGYLPPGYIPPGKGPIKLKTPGYLPPINKRLPPWETNDNPPDPKIAPSAPIYKK